MPIYALGDLVPTIHPSAFVHPDAVLIGDVVLGAEASVWPGAVLRGDNNRISVGDQTSVQDGTIVHCTEELATVIGARCVVGHNAHLEGCTIHDDALVGSGSVVLHRAVIHSWALVGAQALVQPDLEVPSRAMALGVPARIRPDSVTEDMITPGVTMYVHKARNYPGTMRLITP
ncbi:MAG TPA: gamma carbonic anhydrase family protein [Actinomycetota bacterium]|jgi:carbonic anhydrase/acetyltransferase-like protein (isoleucine patch superfamily)|nr:gamma carbonic anhydrase family protein [Actinomycetota bacterium]